MKWECEKRNRGHWSSCADVRATSLNNLLVSARVLFTGGMYNDTADLSALMN